MTIFTSKYVTFQAFRRVFFIKENFFVFIKIANLQRFGFKKKRVFRLIFFLSRKKSVFRFFLFFLNCHIKTKLFSFYQNFISSTVWIFKKNTCFSTNSFFLGRKKKCIWIFLVFFKSSHQDETFLFLPKFHIFNGLDLKKTCFSANNFSRPKKRVFLDFSCFFKIVTSRRNFFVFTKITYF